MNLTRYDGYPIGMRISNGKSGLLSTRADDVV